MVMTQVLSITQLLHHKYAGSWIHGPVLTLIKHGLSIQIVFTFSVSDQERPGTSICVQMKNTSLTLEKGFSVLEEPQ